MIKANITDLNCIYNIDKHFYNDTFFTKNDFKKVINGNSRNTIYMSDDKMAYIMIFKMYKNSLYITALAGSKSGRRELLKSLLDISKSGKYKNTRIYTHGKPAWDMKLLELYGFKKIGRGNPDDEIVEFKDDITKLWTYEIYV